MSDRYTTKRGRHLSPSIEAARLYARSPRGQYNRLWLSARNRNIPFTLTLTEWLNVWEDSGRIDEHGIMPGYAMVRRNNTGAYALGNVAIVARSQRKSERGRVYPHRPGAAWEPEYEDPDWRHVHELPDD